VYSTKYELVGNDLTLDFSNEQSGAWILIQYLSFANFLSSALQVLGASSPDDIGEGFFNDWEAASVFFGKFLVLY